MAINQRYTSGTEEDPFKEDIAPIAPHTFMQLDPDFLDKLGIKQLDVHVSPIELSADGHTICLWTIIRQHDQLSAIHTVDIKRVQYECRFFGTEEVCSVYPSISTEHKVAGRRVYVTNFAIAPSVENTVANDVESVLTSSSEQMYDVLPFDCEADIVPHPELFFSVQSADIDDDTDRFSYLYEGLTLYLQSLKNETQKQIQDCAIAAKSPPNIKNTAVISIPSLKNRMKISPHIVSDVATKSSDVDPWSRPTLQELQEVTSHIGKSDVDHNRSAERLDLSVPANIITSHGATIPALTRDINRFGIGLLHRGAVQCDDVTVKISSDTRDYTYLVKIEWCSPADLNGLFMSGGKILGKLDE